MTTTPLRWQQRFENLSRAYVKLASACSLESYSELELAGLVQTFEFTFELTWKTLKDLLNYEGYEVASPRSVIRTALEAKYISAKQCEVLLDALLKRNLLTHTYDEHSVLEAKELIIHSYQPVIAMIIGKLESQIDVK